MDKPVILNGLQLDKWRGIKNAFRTRSSRKLIIVSAIVAIVVAVIMSLGTFFISILSEVKLLQGTLSAMPAVMTENGDETTKEYDVYASDYVVRGDFAAAIYESYTNLEPKDRLELVRKNTNALSATLLDRNGNVVATTASDGRASLAVKSAFAAMAENDKPLYDPNMAGVNEQMNDEDGYVPESDSMPMVYCHRIGDEVLLAEYDYTPFGKVLVAQNSWSTICERGLSGMNCLAFFVKGDGSFAMYPTPDVDEASDETLRNEVLQAVEAMKGDQLSFDVDATHTANYSIIKMEGEDYFAAYMPVSEMDGSLLLAVPVSTFAGSMVMCDIAIVVLVAFSFFLFSRYAVKSFRKQPIKVDDVKARTKIARKRTRVGIAVVIVVTSILSAMFLMLEGMSNTAAITHAQQSSIKYETDYRIARKKDISKEYSERYTTRATAMAQLLTDYPELRNRESLQMLARISQVEYLMLFDKNGNELFASNGLTGVNVNNPSTGAKQEWRPVLQGYAQVETPTEKNEVTGENQRTIATLITDSAGMPDGFLLTVVNDDELVSEIENATLESTVNNYTARDDQMVAVVDDETGEFLAHSNKEYIGQKAESYIDASIIGRNFEGYAAYDATNMYISGVSSDGKTTLVITNNEEADGIQMINLCLIAAVEVLILLIFYPAAASLTAKYVRERPEERKSRDKRIPISIFYRGYVGYIAILSVVAFLGCVYGFWNSFLFVFAGRWTPGVHLFAVWSCLFTYAIFQYITMGLHSLMNRIDGQVNAQAKTLARLADSLISYAVAILMIIMILSDLGVDTAAIIGSVSIVSIAIGMGSKDLITDIVAGLFIIAEGTLSVGDIVEIGGWRGRVTDMGVRTTQITNEHNDVKIITNGKIGDVVNLSKVKTACTEEFTIPRTVELAELPELVARYIERAVEDIPEISESLELDAVTAITDTSYTVRLHYLVNEADRESATIRLRNNMQLLLESEEK